jgi:hypothetical protein
MKTIKKSIIILLIFGVGIAQTNAQVSSTSSNLVAQPVPDRTVLFSVTDAGVSKPIIWGLDLAWLSESNIKRGIAFMGADRVDVVRASFQPTHPLVNGDLQTAQINDLNTRLNLISLTGAKTKVVLNCDHPSVHSSYLGNAANWAQLIDATTRRVQERGRSVISVSPFNEPDFGWGQYTGSNGQLDFYNICGELRKNPRFDTIRIGGGNTLNCDQALPWYNYLKARLDEGNTHQLAGSFNSYANFFTTVRANGDHAANDELHNVMEAMVGVEYGMQTGIWWGTAEYARGEFVKASDGVRLGYAEHRPNWTAASVYRGVEGKVQAFGGTSERQGVTSTYRFVSKDKDVYYDGYGPQREYSMVLPGGSGYQNGQTNAERVVSISWGDDIQPVINGRYVVVNRNSGKVMEVAAGSTTAGANVRQITNTGANYHQWNVTPVGLRIGGDFSYFTFTAVHSGKSLDIFNWSLDNGGNIVSWDDVKGANQQWYLEYAEDGWFYIRSRHSAKCLEVVNSSIAAGANIQQWEKNGGANQQWRFLPVGTTVEFVAPVAPSNLTANANATSIRLDWSASTDADVSGYTVFRSESDDGSYNTIARNLKSTAFVDNTVTPGVTYFYTVKAVDNSLNRSAYSNEVSMSASGNKDLVALYKFETNTLDSTLNLNHCATYGGASFIDGKFGNKVLSLNGSNAFAQLPSNIASSQEITIAAWVYLRSTSLWQRIFDFGNDQTQYMFLTPRSGSSQLNFTIKNGDAEQILNAPALPTLTWSHVAVTMGTSGVRMYVNGVQVAESNTITIRPNDIKPILNYIGRSQYPDPLLNASVDDFSVYNYELSANEIAQISEVISSEASAIDYNNTISIWPVPANDILNVSFSNQIIYNNSILKLLNLDGRVILTKTVSNNSDTKINVTNLPAGIYMLQLTGKEESWMKKVIIKH